MRHKIENGDLSEDVEFMLDAAFSRKLVRLAFLDDRTSATPNGYIFSMSVNSSNEDGDFASAQNHEFSLKIASGALPPKRIVNGVAAPFV